MLSLAEVTITSKKSSGWKIGALFNSFFKIGGEL
jgi:hypothetical protein